MNHNHDNKEKVSKKHDCNCGKECLCYAAEKLTVSCGCKMEAKQYEYKSGHSRCHEEHANQESAIKPEEGEGIVYTSTPKSLVWRYTCPMHPEVVKDVPGKCPGCGMDLIPKTVSVKDNAGGHEKHNVSAISHKDHETAMTSPAMAKEMERDMRRRFFISLILSVPIFLYSPVAINFFKLTLPSPIPVNWLLFILTTPIVFWTGSIFITGTYYSLRAKKLNMAVLIATGVLAAYLFSVLLTIVRPGSETFYEAAALLVTFVLFGHWMEMKSRRGTSDALRALFDLVPPKARVIRAGKEMEILTSEIIHDDIVVLRPGDKVPVDGVITDGESSIDESLVTGESIPVVKEIGNKVIGGSVNQTGTVKFKAMQVGSETVLAQIIKLVETAQNSKAPGQRIADKAAGWLVVVAISSGLAAFLGWYFGAGVGLLTALTFAISAVVIACPDALGLATPTAVAVGTGIGAKHNILIKDAATLENTSRLTAIVLDKTGTLTGGKPKVTEVIAQSGYDADELIVTGGAVEAGSNHPISLAILEEAKKRGLKIDRKAEKFEAVGGHGVRAVIDGRVVIAGTERFMRQSGVDLSILRSGIDRLLGSGNTISIVAIDGKIAGVIGVADTIRPTAKKTVTALQALGLEVAMITGDHEEVAKAIAKELGIDRYFAQVLPEEKADYVKKLQEEGKFVAMVGDGINDAPALAQADIGIAIGAGTDVAIETGNIVLMKSDPYDIVSAIRLSKATVVKMKQNLFWAAIYNMLAIPVAAGVFYSSLGWSLRPEISALLMSASSIIVATNAVLLKRIESKL